MRARRPRSAAAAALLLLAALAACGGGGGTAGSGSTAPVPISAGGPRSAPTATVPSVAPTLSVPTAAPAVTDCPSTHPVETTLVPIGPEFADLVVDLRGCTDAAQSSLWVRNDSLWVWRVVRPALPPALAMTGTDLQVDAFRTLVATRAPTGRLLEPGRALTLDLRVDFLLLPDGPATSLWQTLSAVVTVAQDQALGTATDVLTGRSKARAAAAECGLASYDAVSALTSGDLAQQAQQAPSLYVQDSLGLATGAADCAQSLDDWSRSRRPTAATVTVTDAFARLLGAQHRTGAFDRLITNLPKIAALAK